MTVQTKWICDGCDDERVVKEGASSSDWKEITAQVDGLNGYPTSLPSPFRLHFHLCPACATRYAENFNPQRWDRVMTEDSHP